jgi:hypothetical protein
MRGAESGELRVMRDLRKEVILKPVFENEAGEDSGSGNR